jgi:hypothetical protein
MGAIMWTPREYTAGIGLIPSASIEFDRGPERAVAEVRLVP